MKKSRTTWLLIRFYLGLRAIVLILISLIFFGIAVARDMVDSDTLTGGPESRLVDEEGYPMVGSIDDISKITAAPLVMVAFGLFLSALCSLVMIPERKWGLWGSAAWNLFACLCFVYIGIKSDTWNESHSLLVAVSVGLSIFDFAVLHRSLYGGRQTV